MYNIHTYICLYIYIYIEIADIGCFLFPPRSPVKKVEWNTARKAQHFYTTNGPIPVTSAPERKSKEPRRLNEGNRWVETHNCVHGKHRDSSNSCLVNDYLVGGFNPFEKYWSNWIISPSRGENKKNWNHHLVIIPKPDFGGFEGRIPLRIHHPSDGVNLWKFTIGKKNHRNWDVHTNMYTYTYTCIIYTYSIDML